MNRLYQLLSLVALLLFTGCVSAPKSAPRFDFDGVVADEQHHSITNASVEFYERVYDGVSLGRWLLVGRTNCNSVGTFHGSFTNQMLLVLAQAPNLAPGWKNFKRGHSNSTGHEFLLGHGTSLDGVIVDQRGHRIDDANVSVIEIGLSDPTEPHLMGSPAQKLFSTRSGHYGRFQLNGLPVGADISLIAEKPGLAFIEPPHNPKHTDSLQFVSGQHKIKLTLVPAGSIDGKVVLESTTVPLSHVLVQMRRAKANYTYDTGHAAVETDAAGHFHFSNVAPGEYFLTPDFTKLSTQDWVGGYVKTDVKPDLVPSTITITASHGGLLNLKALQIQSNFPLSGIPISAETANYSASGLTHLNGLLSFRLPAGRYKVTAINYDVFIQTNVVIKTGSKIPVTFKLNQPITLQGMVENPDGSPASDVQVNSFPNSIKPVISDRFGHFSLLWFQALGTPTFPAFIEFIVARDHDHNLATISEISDTNHSAIVLKLAPALTISGTVTDTNGAFVTNASVNLTMNVRFKSSFSSSTIEFFHSTPNAPGQFKFTALPKDNDYSLVAYAPGYRPAHINLTNSTTRLGTIENPPIILQPSEP